MHYYLNATIGRDDAPGTLERPWKTLARAERTHYAPGDSLRLHGGDTFEGTLTLSPKNVQGAITVESYGGGRATIHSPGPSALLAKNLGGVTVRDLNVTGPGRTGVPGNGIEIVTDLPHAVKLKEIRLEDIRASGFGYAGIMVHGSPADNSQSGFQNVQIRRCDAHDNVYYGIYVTGVWDTHAVGYANANVTIAHCRVWDNHGDPDYLDNHSGSGMLLDDCDGGLIEHCEAWNNGGLCRCKIGGPCGLWTHASDRVTIQDCESHHNKTGGAMDGAGFDFDGGVTNAVIQRCYSHDNDGAGFLIYNYADAPHTFHSNTCRNNLSVNDGRKNGYAGIFLGNDGTPMRDLIVENNTVIVHGTPDGTPCAIKVYRIESARFSGNTLVAADGRPLLDAANVGGLRFERNAYWTEGGPFLMHWNGQDVHSLADWKAASGQEKK